MAGVKSIGTKLTLKGEGSEQDLTLSNLESIGEQTSSTEEIDVTTLDSPGGNREFVAGSSDNGSVAVVANNLYDGQAEILQSLKSSGEVREWVTEFNSGATLTYDAFIQEFTFGEATTDGKDTVSFSLRVSGEPVYDEGSSS